MNLIEIAALTEDQAREYLEATRWPEGAVCAHCDSKNVHKLEGDSTRPGLYKCRACRKQFSVMVNTIMHRSHLSCRQWMIAYHLVCSSKKGFSAHQLGRVLGITYKSAWHLAHRIRHAMQEQPLKGLLSGTIEVDETYIGGKPRKKGVSKRGRGTKKAPVVVLVERDGKARSMPVERVTSKELKGAIREIVDRESTINTDELNVYKGIGKDFKGGHKTVNHGLGEYSRDDVHINTAESYFALLKRGVNGTFHHVSKHHLHRYCDEFAFRWNSRKVDDGQRVRLLVKEIGGKRLTYKQPK